MAITFNVETGTGASDSTSYASLETAEGWMDSYGYDWSAETDDTLSVKLNKATKYVDGFYSGKFPGYRTNDDQALEWPRDDAYYLDGVAIEDNVIPPEIINATCAACALLVSGTSLDITVEDASVKSESVTIGPISESKTYVTGRSNSRIFSSVVSDELVRLVSSFGRMRVTRG